jgi:hypothetical protein
MKPTIKLLMPIIICFSLSGIIKAQESYSSFPTWDNELRSGSGGRPGITEPPTDDTNPKAPNGTVGDAIYVVLALGACYTIVKSRKKVKEVNI